jgi:DNA-binding CsgD family transcriptional regulator
VKSPRLSQTQLLVAELVAQGRSNPEVAAVLDLSPKTIEWHLSHVYRKLGVRRRGELAAALEGDTPLGRATGEVESRGPLPGGSAADKYGLQPGRAEAE